MACGTKEYFYNKRISFTGTRSQNHCRNRLTSLTPCHVMELCHKITLAPNPEVNKGYLFELCSFVAASSSLFLIQETAGTPYSTAMTPKLGLLAVYFQSLLAFRFNRELVANEKAMCGPGEGSCEMGSCCSEMGFCGTTAEYCSGSQCQLDYSHTCDTL